MTVSIVLSNYTESNKTWNACSYYLLVLVLEHSLYLQPVMQSRQA